MIKFSLIKKSGGLSWWRVCYHQGLHCLVINRPGVAGAVLQSSFIDSLIL